MKARITWKGEEGVTTDNQWRGITFKKGEAVETEDEAVIVKAAKNRYYDVEMIEGELPPDPPTVVPPSETSAQHHVGKPGEPTGITAAGGAAQPRPANETAQPAPPSPSPGVAPRTGQPAPPASVAARTPQEAQQAARDSATGSAGPGGQKPNVAPGRVESPGSPDNAVGGSKNDAKSGR